MGIKQIIAVASAKGGVGKSTICANLASHFAKDFKVGILDADIYGPNQHILFNVSDSKPEVKTIDNKKLFIPIEINKIFLNSMGFILDNDKAAMWRGPMLSGAIKQLKDLTQWGDLDYLFIDMPPGTGDIQLTLAQRVPLAGAVIVTTPQDIALLDARKGIEMFRKVEVPVLGIVENMSTHVCTHCGHEEPVFGAGGGESVAAQYDTVLLAQLPLTLALRAASDDGQPLPTAAPDSPLSETFMALAQQVGERVSQTEQNAPVIRIFDD